MNDAPVVPGTARLRTERPDDGPPLPALAIPPCLVRKRNQPELPE